MKALRVACGGLIVIFLISVVCGLGGLLAPPVELIFYLVVGWIPFLKRTISVMTIEPAAVAIAGGALVVLTVVAHRFARWLFGSFHASPSGESPRWRLRWTIASALLVVFTFAAGIAMVGVFHEVWWLVSSNKPLLVTVSGAREAGRRASSINHLEQMGLAFDNYHANEKRFPPGGTFNQFGEMLHSWETMLLPYMDYRMYAPPKQELPWNHPENAFTFQKSIPEFVNPQIGGESKSPDGYALSHYAVNCRVMHGNFSLRKEDVKDGLSHTIMGGEVNANFKPWGDPVNWRDPAIGLGKPEGFGGPWNSGGTNMLFMDGSVQMINKDIDPQVLKALSTPADGDDTHDFFEKN